MPSLLDKAKAAGIKPANAPASSGFMGMGTPPAPAPTSSSTAPSPLLLKAQKLGIKPANPPAPPAPGFFDSMKKDIGDSYNSHSADIVAAGTRQNQGKQGTPSTLLQILGAGAGLANDTIGAIAKPVIAGANTVAKGLIPGLAGVEDVGSKVIGEAAKTPFAGTGKSIPDLYTAWKTQHPEAAANLESFANVGALAGNALGVEQVGKLGVEGAINAASTAKEFVANTGARADAKIVQSALDRIAPDVNAMTDVQRTKLAGESVREGSATTPRLNEGGFLKGRTVNLTPAEKKAAQTLSEVPGYSPKLTNLETHNLIQKEIGSTADKLATSLQNEKQILPRKEIVSVVKKAVDEVPQESLLLQKSDPVIKNYMRVARNAVDQNDGTLKGVLDVRKTMDAAYENARGKLAFGSDKISALDDVHKAGRNALNDYLIEHANNTDVKALLQKQSQLYTADDAILPKVGGEAGSTVKRAYNVVKEHPYVAGAVGAKIINDTSKKITGIGF